MADFPSETAPKPSLSAQGLSLRRGGRIVIDRLSLDIPQGGTTALIGPNGCGKSTLLAGLARILHPHQGEVLLDGRAIHRMPSRALARRLGLKLPIQPGKGYSMTFPRPALAPSRALVLKEPSVCVTTWGDGFRLGSTMEFSGYDDRPNPVRLAALRRAAAEFLHEPGAGEPLEQWHGWRPMTWDDLPVIGRAPRHANLVLATGHGMLGVSMAPITGLLVHDLVLRRPPRLDLAPLSPSRFG